MAFPDDVREIKFVESQSHRFFIGDHEIPYVTCARARTHKASVGV